MDAGDLIGIAGTIVAALIGVGGLAIVLGVESRDRYRGRLDDTLSGVIAALAQRAEDLEVWADYKPAPRAGSSQVQPLFDNWERTRRQAAPGGPLDTGLQAAVEIAWLAAHKAPDRACLAALGAATFNLKLAIRPWQVERSGRIAADIRRWRTKEIDGQEFISRMDQYAADARGSGEAYEREQAEKRAEQEQADAQAAVERALRAEKSKVRIDTDADVRSQGRGE